MIIGIDGNEANVTKRLGVGIIAYNLLLQFSKINYPPQISKIIIYLKNNPVDSMPKPNSKLEYRVLTPGKLWTQWRLPLDLYLHKPRPAVFFTPTHYAPRFSPIPTVISIMDLAYIFYPEMFKKTDLYKLRNWSSYSIKNAKKVLTISKSSKNDIIKEYKIPEENVAVIYPGIKQDLQDKYLSNDMNSLKSKYGISTNFILFVGTIQPRKNIGRLIGAFAKVISSKDMPVDLQLIIVGKKGWLYEDILKKPKELDIEKKVKFLEFISDDELKLFYKEAICFVLPSLYEGFGLPVLEAMQNGCPVITSNISSLPEAGGDAALYVNPLDVNDIAEKITKLIAQPELRKNLMEKSKTQLAKFNWEKTAKETIKILEEVGKNK